MFKRHREVKLGSRIACAVKCIPSLKIVALSVLTSRKGSLVLLRKDIGLRSGTLQADSTTEHWAKRLLVPFTRDRLECYVSVAQQELGMTCSLPRYHIVHSWGARAESLVLAAAEAVNGGPPPNVRDLLSIEWHEHFNPTNLDQCLWICPFTVNQHTVDICKCVHPLLPVRDCKFVVCCLVCCGFISSCGRSQTNWVWGARGGVRGWVFIISQALGLIQFL